MSHLINLRAAILEYIDETKAAGKVVDINGTAIRLATKFPQTGLTIDEIASLIERTAARHNVVNRPGIGAGPDVGIRPAKRSE